MNYRHSSTLSRLAERDDRIDYYECDQDGHWLILIGGFRSEHGASAIRSDTVRQALDAVSLIEIGTTY